MRAAVCLMIVPLTFTEALCVLLYPRDQRVPPMRWWNLHVQNPIFWGTKCWLGHVCCWGKPWIGEKHAFMRQHCEAKHCRSFAGSMPYRRIDYVDSNATSTPVSKVVTKAEAASTAPLEPPTKRAKLFPDPQVLWKRRRFWCLRGCKRSAWSCTGFLQPNKENLGHQVLCLRLFMNGLFLKSSGCITLL